MYCTPFSPHSTNHCYRIDGIQIVCVSNLLSILRNKSDKLQVPSYGTIANNEVVKIECLDWTGGQIKNDDSADDIKNVDLTQIHYLSGPFDIETAEPGDVLLVEIQDVQPFEDQPWGFTGVFARENGGGFLDEIYPEP
jgi:formamidase